MSDRELLRRERGALVGLHMRTATAARKRRGHRREVVMKVGRFDDQRRSGKLRETHAATLIRDRCSRDQRLLGRAERLRDPEVEHSPRDLDAREADDRRTDTDDGRHPTRERE